MAERLRGATSPYLLQHAGNPVDWWQWGDEAFAEARRRDVAVLLSIGYSACHWCHVMAHESFEDQATADLVNSHLVAIKVDREERPDVDAVYMTVTQALTGQGGWPMTVFLTPDREPFYCGTYYPKEIFARLVLAISGAWRENRGEVSGRARQIAAAIAETAGQGSAGDGVAVLADAAELCDTAVGSLAGRYDARRGGFGGAPKFPPSTVLEFLLRHSERAVAASSGGEALAMVAGTAQAMARGGIYDQLGGGFARYSVDDGWVVPHFEKMLYDNAQLARVYAHWWRRSDGSSELARRVAVQTCDWMLADLLTPQGGFASALDADSEGTEGAFYVWTPGELAEVLGADDGAYAASLFSVTKAGTFEHGRSVLQLLADPDDQERYDSIRSRLRSARAKRTWPGRDDKVVAAWNGLAITALAEAGLLFARLDYVAAASRAAELIEAVHMSGGRLARTSRDGVAGPSAGVLEDYACVAAGFLALSGVTGEDRWVGLAGSLLDTALDRFRAGCRRVLRHCGRQRRAHLPPGRPGRRACTFRHLRHRRGAAQLLGTDRLRGAPGRRRRGAQAASGPGRQVSAGRRLGAGSGRGRGGRACRDRDHRAGRRRTDQGLAPGGRARRRPWRRDRDRAWRRARHRDGAAAHRA